MNKLSLKDQSEEIRRIARESNVEGNFFFETRFEEYLFQMKALNDTKKALMEDGLVTTKTYVKGRENLYRNPQLDAYIKLITASNLTVATLLKIIRQFKIESDGGNKDFDPLMAAINGVGDDDDSDD